MYDDTTAIMPTDLPTISTLSIYPDKKAVTNDENASPKKQQLIGATTMSIFNGIKTKYRNTINAIDDYKEYAASTEGKIKFGIMFVGLVGGAALAYRSPSKRLWYKRMLPIGTLSLAASACYPYKALAVAKSTAHGVATTYNVTKIAVTYCYSKLQKMKNEENLNAVNIPESGTEEQEELEYTINEKGILTSKKDSVQDTPQQQTSDEEKESPETNTQEDTESNQTEIFKLIPKKPEPVSLSNSVMWSQKTDLYATLSAPKSIEKAVDDVNVLGDAGQGSPDDADLYTTR